MMSAFGNALHYGFGETRVATVALLTFMVLSGRYSGGVVMAKFSGQTVKFANRLYRHPNVRVDLDLHPIWPAAKKHLERGNTFHFTCIA